MTIYHTSAISIAEKEQSTENYCAGNGSTKNTPTKLLVGDLAAMDEFVGNLNLPIPEPVIENVEGICTSEFPTIHKTHMGMGTGGWRQKLQTNTNITRICDCNIGEIPQSSDIKFDEGKRESDIYGVILTSWSASLSKGIVYQDIECVSARKSYNCDTTGTTAIPAQSTGAPALVTYCEVTIDSITQSTLNMTEFSHKIAIELADPYCIGSEYALEPIMMKRTHSFSCVCKDEGSNTWQTDLDNYTIQNATILITYKSAAATTIESIQYTNCTVSKTSLGQFPERGIQLNRYEFQTTENTAVTFP